MNEKRFELAYEQGDWWAVRDGDITLWKEEVVGLLNEQQSTINELKEAIDYLKTVIRYTIPNEMVADVFKQIGEEYE